MPWNNNFVKTEARPQTNSIGKLNPNLNASKLRNVSKTQIKNHLIACNF